MVTASSSDSSASNAVVTDSVSLCLRGFSGRGHEHLIECQPGKVSLISKIPSNDSYRKALCELRDVEKVFLSLGSAPVSEDRVFQINDEFEWSNFRTVAEVVSSYVDQDSDLESLVEAGLEKRQGEAPENLSLLDTVRLALVCAFSNDAEVIHIDFEGLNFASSEEQTVAALMLEKISGSSKIVVATGLEQVPESWSQSPLVSVKGSSHQGNRLIDKAKTSASREESASAEQSSARSTKRSKRSSTLTKVDKRSRFTRIFGSLKSLKLPSRKSNKSALDD